MKKVMSSLDFFTKRNDSVPELGAMGGQKAENLLVVFDMDHTMVRWRPTTGLDSFLSCGDSG